MKNCIIHIRVPREIKKYVEKTDNVKLVDIKGTKWFAVTEREKELIKEYLIIVLKTAHCEDEMNLSMCMLPKYQRLYSQALLISSK